MRRPVGARGIGRAAALAVLFVGRERPLAAATSAETASAPAGEYSIQWVADPSHTNRIVVRVAGLDGRTLESLKGVRWDRGNWEHVFAVFVKQGSLAAEIGLPPMLGTYAVESGGIRFEPTYPLDPGVRYRAMFHPDQLPGRKGHRAEPVASDFRMPARSTVPTTEVREIYPTADTLPENLLKFYLEFSGPMSGGQIYDHIHLRNKDGKDVELPFLEIDEELWNPAMTRLTLFIDPGRIKRGVQPLEEVGPALAEGGHFSLVIDEGWRDATGVHLKRSFIKNFRVGPADREPPDPARWKVEPPRSGGRETLTVDFPEPMDHALARRVIRVANSSGELVAGETLLENEERRWLFRPADAWKPGSYSLAVQTTIEDLAGNNIGKPFEVDLFESVQRRLGSSVVKVPFDVH